ncbi:MAG: hemolysin III family protein [Candidatus Dormibacteraeota bacterium]|nr:hemolysin III family protein [Candidatus Dormibacteraeota bacterium]MBV9524477.1 hemolysin III family protein [Candidatus Dormibacteraeota bacterium]
MEVEQRPLLRGWSHAVAVVPALTGAIALVLLTRGSPGKQMSLLVYGAAVTLLFTVSALYHRVPWSPPWRAVWRRLDHANIFVVIAATYTPIAANMLDGWLRVAVLTGIWLAALCGASLVAAPVELPRPVMAAVYVGVGWLAILIIPVLYTRLGALGLVMLLGGGALYSLGAVMYALRRPRLWPRVFGYHEAFHLLVIAATAVFFMVIAATVLPAGRS